MAHLYDPRAKDVSKAELMGGIGFDRDLSIAGRAMVKTAKGDYVQKLVKVERPSTHDHVKMNKSKANLQRSPPDPNACHTSGSSGEIRIQ